MSKLKKISIITIILYMLFITKTFAATATVTVSAARLREEASTTSNILTNIYEGEKVEILEKNGEWYKVKYGSNVGYLKNNLIKEDSTSNETITKKEDNTASNNSENPENTTYDSSKLVTTVQTKLRYQPSMMSNVIIQIEVGKELTKNDEIGNWIQVSDGAVTGWIIKNKTLDKNQVQNNSSNSENNSKPEEKDSETPTNTDANRNESNIQNNTVKENKIEENTVSEKSNQSEKNNQSQLTNSNKKGIVNVETAKVRESADKTSKVVGFLDYNDEITITAEEGEWYKFTEKDAAGYVHKTLITLIEDENISSRGTNEDRETGKSNITENISEKADDSLSKETTQTISSNNKGQEVVDLAKKYLGYKYVVGGKNPESGFDCSGFTRYVYLQFGYSLGSTAASQNNLGVEVSRNDLKPGDLILFYDEGKNKIGHTGIYISNGEFIHSANPTRGVVTDNLNTNSYYNERFITARRIVE